jgi:hypothetical protein
MRYAQALKKELSPEAQAEVKKTTVTAEKKKAAPPHTQLRETVTKEVEARVELLGGEKKEKKERTEEKAAEVGERVLIFIYIYTYKPKYNGCLCVHIYTIYILYYVCVCVCVFI